MYVLFSKLQITVNFQIYLYISFFMNLIHIFTIFIIWYIFMNSRYYIYETSGMCRYTVYAYE